VVVAGRRFFAAQKIKLGGVQVSKIEKKLVAFSVLLAAVLTVPQSASAMHIMEGYLPPAYCVAWGVLCLPFLVVGIIRIRHTVQNQRKSLLLLAMSGAFVFVISSLKIPSVTGSCSHMTGTGLAAILFGPTYATVLGLIVLIFQAILLAHGGLTTLGANTFSMAIAGPLLSFALYKLLGRCKVNRKVNIFLSAALGDLFTYCVTSVQLALAYPSAEGGVARSAVEFLGVFAPTQLPLALIEGILTVIVVIGLESYAKSELTEIGFLKEGA
jgi:cobalt/nickel transport system permease protein